MIPAEPSRSNPERAVKHDDREEILARLGSATLGECGARPLPPRVHGIWPGCALAAPALPESHTRDPSCWYEQNRRSGEVGGRP
jgi:hypothetical protein